MKNLKNYVKNYIKSYINESVWDIEDNVEDDNKESILNDIKKFIEDNYENNISQECEIVFDEKKGKYVVNCRESVALKSNSKQIANEMFEWGTINGWFECSGCKNLYSSFSRPITYLGKRSIIVPNATFTSSRSKNISERGEYTLILFFSKNAASFLTLSCFTELNKKAI